MVKRVWGEPLEAESVEEWSKRNHNIILNNMK